MAAERLRRGDGPSPKSRISPSLRSGPRSGSGLRRWTPPSPRSSAPGRPGPHGPPAPRVPGPPKTVSATAGFDGALSSAAGVGKRTVAGLYGTTSDQPGGVYGTTSVHERAKKGPPAVTGGRRN